MTDVIANLEAAYQARLAEWAQRWELKHPDEAKRMRDEIDQHFGREPEPGSLVWMAREAAMVEAIRQKKGWPTEREWVRLQAGEEPAPPRYVPPSLKTPTRERHDAKAKAAGDS